MTLSVKHAKVVASSDSGDGKVSSNAWNDEHVLKGTANMLVGFDGDGLATEIDPSGIGGSLVSVKAFGALGDTVLSGTILIPGSASVISGTDDTAAFQAAIDAVASTGGSLYVPNGAYKITSYLTLCANLTILLSAGAVIVATHAGGGGATTDENVRNGSLFYSNWPSNGSNNANIRIEGGTLLCTNGANVGAAFYDNCGTYIKLKPNNIVGFKYGVIFDQSELADVLEANVHPADAGGACVWIVNGALLKSGNTAGFTNRIGVSGCQLNTGRANSTDLIRDDGGIEHCYGPRNNYNGGDNQLRICGVSMFQIHGGEFEAGNTPISLNSLSSDGTTSFGTPAGAMFGGTLADGVSGKQVDFHTSGSFCSFFGVKFGGASYPVAGTLDATIRFYGCTNFRTDKAWVDNTNCWLIVDTAPINIENNANTAIASPSGVHINGRIRSTNAAGLALTIPNDTSRTFAIGAYFELDQTTSAGVVSFVADTGVTITGPTASSSQYQRLIATKIAANTWETELRVQNPLTAFLRPSDNLSDVANPSTALANLGGLAAANNLSDLANAATARANLGLGTAATQASTAFAPASPQIQSVTSSATVTPTFANDQVNITAQAVGLTLANPTGTAVDGWGIVVRIKDNGTAQTIAFGTQYRAVGGALPTTTTAGKVMYIPMEYNAAATKWDVFPAQIEV